MEQIIFILAMGLMSVIVIAALDLFSRQADEREQALWAALLRMKETLEHEIHEEGKLTRKESQEIKTRLTQERKDLNVIEKQTKPIKVPYMGSGGGVAGEDY